MSVRTIEDLRPQYAAKFREMATLMEQSQVQPIGVFVSFFWENQGLTRMCKREPGINHLTVAGAFLMQATGEAMLPMARVIPETDGPPA